MNTTRVNVLGATVVGLLVLLLIALLAAFPLVTILALNTLFTLGIPFNFYTWAAMVWLNIVVFIRFKI